MYQGQEGNLGYERDKILTVFVSVSCVRYS